MECSPSQFSNSGTGIPQHILDDLCSRFIINIPEEERSDLIRIFFQIELAHWFYLDFYCQEQAELRPCGIKDFSAQIFHHCPTLIEHADNVGQILGSWREYKMAVPTYGAIILDSTLSNCLLVQGFWSKASWGFPKGKVNEEEAPEACAIREVYEETGYDITELIDRDEYIEYKMNEQLSRLYIVPNVPMDTEFIPRTRQEIKKVSWFVVDQLPAHKKDPNSRTYFNLPTNAFFMVIPFVKPLRKWIGQRHGNFDSESDSGYKKRGSGQRQRADSMESGGQRLRPVKLFTAKNSKDRSGKGRSLSTSPSQANKQNKQRRASSPKKILKRDSSGGSNLKRTALVPDYMDFGGGGGKRQSRKDVFSASSWTNFKLDTEAVLACL